MNDKTKKHSKLIALLLVFMMIFTMIPSTAFAAESSESTVIYQNGVDGSNWPYDYYYVDTLALSGAEVSYINGTDVYLTHTTAADAELTFTVTAGGNQSGNLGINWNYDSTNTKTYTTSLVDGKATVKIYAYKASGAGVSRNGTKTFNISIAEPNESPTLAEGYAVETSAEVTSGTAYTLDLTKVFADKDGDALTYTVSVDGGTATKTESAYSYLNAIPGTYTLKFTATDGKTLAAKQPTHTVTLTVKNSEATYDVGVTVPEDISPVFYAVNAVNSGSVVKGDQLVFENGTVKVPENISRIMWEVESMVGFSAPVSAGASIELAKVTFDAKFDSGEADTTATVKITDAEGVKTIGNGTDTYILPSISGFTYNVTTSNSAYNNVALEEQTPTSGSVKVTFGQKHFTVIAPKDSVVSAGTLAGSFKYTFASTISKETVGDTVVYKFAPLSGNAFVRVQRPDDKDAVTYWDWKSSKADGQTITITEEMLFMNDSGDDVFNDDTVYRNFEKYAMDLGDVYMNINNQGYINLNVGDEKGLNMFRNWMAIEAFTNAKISLPDFSYEIINIEGSDVIEIEPDANNSAAATLKAKGEGTAIVLVTYDAMYSDSTVGNNMGYAGGGNRYAAIWPDRTGVFVVSVGKDGTAINSNMTCNGAIFDAEHSPQFYVGDKGATVTFKPDEGVTVTVNRSTVGTETLSFGTFTNEGVTVAEDGTVTVSGLKTGRHIIKLEKDGVASYQVVTATQATVQYVSADGRDLGSNPIVPPGGTFYAKIKGLTNPAEKFPTKYNFNTQLTYKDQNGNAYKNSSGAVYGQYDFSSTEQVIEVTVPADWTEERITLNGFFKMGGFSGGSIGDHRKVSYGVASGMAHGSSAGMELGTLPELSVEVREIPATNLTLDKEKIKVEVDESETILATVEPANTTDAVQWSSSDESIATVENGVVTGVKAGTAVITAKIRDLTLTCTVETYGEPKEIHIITGSGRPSSSKPALSEIMLKGIKGTLKDGYTETEYTVVVDDATSKTKAVKIRMTPYFRTSSNAKNFYYWVNTPKQTHMSRNLASVENPCTMSVTPDWDGNNAVITVGMGNDAGIGAKTYTITLHKHSYDAEVVDEKYLVSEADFDSKAVYSKSCECGVASTTDTFENGETLGAKVKNAAKKAVAEYKDADDYRDAQKTELAEVIEAANTAIDAAESEAEAAAAVEAAKAAMDAIKTDAQLDQEEAEAAAAALAQAKEEAKKAVAEYKNADDYRDAEKAELAEAIEAANTAIDAAESEEEVAAAVEAAKVAMDAIKTDAQLDQEEAEAAAAALAQAKEEAKKAVAEYKNADDYRDAQKTELAAAIEAANNAIDAAETEEEVAAAVEAAKAAMDAIKTDAQLDQEEADNEGQPPEGPAEPETPVVPEEPADDEEVMVPGETEGEDEGTEELEEPTDSDDPADEEETEVIVDDEDLTNEDTEDVSQDAEVEDTESADTGDKNQPVVYLTAILAAVLALAGIRRREN